MWHNVIATVKPVCNDHLYYKIYHLCFIQHCVLMKTEGANLLVLTMFFCNSSRWPLVTYMSSRRQRRIPLGGRYRQVSLYNVLYIYKYIPTDYAGRIVSIYHKTGSISNQHLNRSVLSNAILWSTHYSCISKHCLLTGGPRVWWFGQARTPVRVVSDRFWLHLGDENPSPKIDETNLCGQR